MQFMIGLVSQALGFFNRTSQAELRFADVEMPHGSRYSNERQRVQELYTDLGNAAALLQGGPSGCKEGCLHLGSCIAVCPAGAISKDEKGNVTVDKEKCIGCGKCVSVCPNNVIKLVPYSLEYICACNNHEPGGKVRKTCQVGCIGCKMCETKVQGSPFTVDSFLSSNDWNKDQSTAGEAAEICPQKCIVRRS